MRLSLQSAWISLAALVAIGCGGAVGSRTTTTTNPGSNPYFGTYSGEMYSVGQNASGTVTFTVNRPGAINGSYVVGSTTTVFTGTMSQTGTATITDSGGSTSTGQFGPSGAPTSEASLTGGSAGTLLFTVVRNPIGPKSGGNPFNGDYSGTVTNQTTGTTEPIVLIINSSGAVTGDDVLDDGSTPKLGSVGGSVAADGTATLSVSVIGAQGTTIGGSLSLSGASLTGTGTDSSGNTLKFKMNLF